MSSPGDPTMVVCLVGAEGGLDALAELLAGLPCDLPCCYTVVLHDVAARAVPVAEVLGRDSALVVREAADGEALVAGEVVVAPPGATIAVEGSVMRLRADDPGRDPGVGESGDTGGFDVLLGSAAESWGRAAVGVVLSGAGDGGLAGMRALRAAGGTVIARDPATAGVAEMPRAAIDADVVDLTLAPGDIGPALQRLTEQIRHGEPGTRPVTLRQDGSRPVERTEDREGSTVDVPEPETRPEVVERIAAAVLAATGIDFSGYKLTTLRRQIKRRMVARRLGDLDVYHDTVVRSREEAEALAAGLLVSVTSFFRDPEVWEGLRGSISELLGTPDAGEQLRIWVPGCAIGPEAYGLAMIVSEVLGDPEDLSQRVKVFATDLDENALRTARKGRYPDGLIEAVPSAMRDRWLRRDGIEWAVTPPLRDCMVFARHNVALDPPFPRIHLVSLRNTLIYFEHATQQQVLRLLHFSLVSGGLLLLGESERIADGHELFEAVNGQDRLYRRRPVAASAAVLPAPVSRATKSRVVAAASEVDERDVVRDLLVYRFAPPSLILDAADHVIEVIGDVSPWCQIAEGRHSRHILALVRQELRGAVRSAVLMARQAGPIRERPVPLDGGETVVVAHRLDDAVGGAEPRLVVSFSSQMPPAPNTATRTAPGSGELEPAGYEAVSADSELATTEAALQATIEQLSGSNEDLQALNEELQAAGEELQASHEEVQASNEELEATNAELAATNAELGATNAELRRRGDDLASANADLENIQASLTSGLILVDRDLRVLRYTPLAVRLFALIDTDLGRPLTAIPATMEIPDLQAELRAAVDDHRDGILEVRGEQSDMLLHFHPYRGPDGAIRGAILVITDITEIAGAHRMAQRRLHDLTAVTEALRETVWQRAEDGQILFLNSRVERLFGLTRRRVIANPDLLLAAVHPQDKERVALASAAVPERPFEMEYRIVRPDGEQRWIHESVVPVPAGEFAPRYTVSTARDVTHRHAGQQETTAQIAMLETVFHNSTFGVLVLDDNDRVLATNEAFAQMSGFDQRSLVGMPVRLLAHDTDAAYGVEIPADQPAVRATVEIAQRRLIARDGTPHVVTVETRTVSGAGDAHRIAIMHDVTQLYEANAELSNRLRFDPHTGLLSRSHFRSRLVAELARAEQHTTMVAVLWVDLDGFKQLNDRYGHQAGDVALREIANRLQQLVRLDDAVGRLGGDEFAILLTDIEHVDDVEPIAQRILTTLRNPVRLRDLRLHFSGTVGIAVAPGDGQDPDILLHNADTAMYAAKAKGKDQRVYFRPAMNDAAEQRASLGQNLAAALRDHQFVMHYQPVIDIRTGAVRSMEALIRWTRDGVTLPAGEFIQIAEQTSQIRTLGTLALDLIDEDLKVLRHTAGVTLPVCVNLSPLQLEERDLIDRLLTWEPPGGLDHIIIEVTEAAALGTSGRPIEALTLLTRLGAHLSIDDFGTGYSNLSLLDRLRPAIIKIDRTLLTGALDQPRGGAVLHAAIQLAHALDTDVVIEGVENEHLWTLVQSLGAEQAQGFHLARPMPLDQLVPWLTQRD